MKQLNLTQSDRSDATAPLAASPLPVLEAVGDQLSFGKVVEPRQFPAAVSAGVKRREALITSLQLHRDGDTESQSGSN